MKEKFKGNCSAEDHVYFTHGNAVNLFIVYVLDTWSGYSNTDFAQGDCLLGSVRLYKSSGADKYGYIGYGKQFFTHTQFSLTNGEWDKHFVISIIIYYLFGVIIFIRTY